MARKTRPRTERRAGERQAEKLTRDLERLARLEPGGSPERPIDLATASLVDVHARGMKCPVCAGPMGLDEHTAEVVQGMRLRVAHVRCRQCGRARAVYFRLVGSGLN